MKGRGQTAAEEATQRRTGEEKMSEWEISPTLEERPVLSSRMRGKDWREGKEGVGDGKRGRDIGRLTDSAWPASLFFFFSLVAESSRNSFDYKCLIEKHGFS